MKLRHMLSIAFIGMMISTAFATTSEPGQKLTTTINQLDNEFPVSVVVNVAEVNANALDGLYKIQPDGMGTFKVEITAVGGHGVDRSKKNGEVVDFNAEGEFSPDAITKRYVNEMKRFGVNVQAAVIRHWPGEESEVSDDLLTGERTGNF